MLAEPTFPHSAKVTWAGWRNCTHLTSSQHFSHFFLLHRYVKPRSCALGLPLLSIDDSQNIRVSHFHSSHMCRSAGLRSTVHAIAQCTAATHQRHVLSPCEGSFAYDADLAW